MSGEYDSRYLSAEDMYLFKTPPDISPSKTQMSCANPI